MTDNVRKLATIETILELRPIPDADMIVAARIRGWDVVVEKDEFQVGDRCVYFEVDSMLDVVDDRFAFLEPRGVRTDVEGHRGHVLKTARLRGLYSQGPALQIELFPELADRPVGDDVTDDLGIIKWEPPIPPELVGAIRGFRPSWIPVTDEDRIQNFSHLLLAREVEWVATEKIDGTSTTFYIDDTGLEGACSRNLDLLPNPNGTTWKLAAQLSIFDRIRDSFPGVKVAVQGETFGEGIQKNPLRVRGHHFAAFALHVGGREVPRSDWPDWLMEIAVPVHDLEFPETLEAALAQVDGMKSAIVRDRKAEGIVWRAGDRTVVSVDGRVNRASFKVISNNYLMKADR